MAYIIASRTIFRFQTLNLIGFSLGSHLIKYCLKQLYYISQYAHSVLNIIQNVVFVAGATYFRNKEKWKNIFSKTVVGRVINCYGNNDCILKYIFKITTFKTAIGIFPVEFDNYNKIKIMIFLI